jgi:hypothetical protein
MTACRTTPSCDASDEASRPFVRNTNEPPFAMSAGMMTAMVESWSRTAMSAAARPP